jgi:hypothetical protein
VGPHARGLTMAAIVLASFAQSIPASADEPQDALISSVNAYRDARGLATVVASRTLQVAAEFMANDVAEHGPPWTPHLSSDGRTARQRMADAGYPVSSTVVSEIIAWGAPTAESAMTIWHNSAAHRWELNDGRYRAAGFGVACWGAFPCVWVVTFGAIVDEVYAPVDYHTTFHGQSSFPVLAPGQVGEWVVSLTNTGKTGWSQSDATDVRLGTWSPQDAPSHLATAAWLAPNRPARQTTAWVGPGQQAWFRVEVRAPVQAGTYRMYVRPVIDGVAWLEDVGAYVEVMVRPAAL